MVVMAKLYDHKVQNLLPGAEGHQGGKWVGNQKRKTEKERWEKKKIFRVRKQLPMQMSWVTWLYSTTKFRYIVHINVLNHNILMHFQKAGTYKRFATPHPNKRLLCNSGQRNTQNGFTFLLLNFSLHTGEEKEESNRNACLNFSFQVGL